MTHPTDLAPRPLAALLLASWLPAALMLTTALTTALALPAAAAADLAGTRQVLLHGRDGSRIHLGDVAFTAQADGRSAFALTLRHAPFKDYFLSMKEFKCVEGGTEIFCHVPYPYAQPATVGPGDLAWLEHALLFMFKTPAEFGAKLWNGVYFQLTPTERGFDGRPQAVDLNRISAPPDKPGLPPYRPALRDDIPAGARWFGRLTIE